MTITAYNLGYLAGIEDQRQSNHRLSYEGYASQARKDFDRYAQMDEQQLCAALNGDYTHGKLTKKRARVLRFYDAYQARHGKAPGSVEIARECNVHRTYVYKVLRETLGV